MDYEMGYLLPPALAIGLLLVASGLGYSYQQLSTNAVLQAQLGRRLGALLIGRQLLRLAALVLLFGSIAGYYHTYTSRQKLMEEQRSARWPSYDKSRLWVAPDPYLEKTDAQSALIAYGRDLIAHTQDYFGPAGLVRPGSTNGMNCQNCHLEAGAKPFGNNYFGVESTYPQMRARSGTLETIPKRINDCFQRSLNGQPIDTSSREMRAMMAYMRWLGTGVPKGEKPKGTGLPDLKFLERPADPAKGEVVYLSKCASCHGPDGQGLPMADGARSYPPLWGDHSYNEAAGLFRMSRFAGYVKANMPFGASFDNPQLSDEEAWDVAAFVNSKPRPKHPFLQQDWPKIEKKPYDHPFGPFADTFPEAQHKYGPFEPIVAYYKAVGKK